jgi:hypothetical protein
MKEELKNLCENTCIAKQLCNKFALPKKHKCCKNYKEGKRCKKCPKR